VGRRSRAPLAREQIAVAAERLREEGWLQAAA
jgi:hypothetical protein